MNIKINDFDGPLDLLLHLIKAKKMEIYDIDIELITKEYINYINTHPELTIDASSEYLVMASELIHLKSKMLLNKNEDEEDSIFDINTEEELKERLLEYEKIKDLAENFHILEEKRKEVFTKLPSSLSEFTTDNKIVNSDVNLEDLLNAFAEFLKRKRDEQPLNTTVTKKELSVEERIKGIRGILHKRGRVNFFELFDSISKPYVIITFLSVLNMGKNGEAVIIQDKNFGEIFIEESRK